MSENDFLYALKDELPQEFSDNLREQLKQIEQEEYVQQETIQPKQTHNTGWLLAVASILVAIFGVIFFVSTRPNLDVLNIVQQLPPTLTNHGEITPENISDLQLITTLGDGFARRIRLSPDGETLAVDSSAGLYLHDANNLNAEPRRIITPENFNIIDYADDGTIYGVSVYQSSGNTVQLMRVDPNTSQTTVLFDLPPAYLNDFEISADGSRLFLQACYPETTELGYCMDSEWLTQVYDTETGHLALEFESVFRFGFSPYVYDSYNSSVVTSISNDGSKYVYLRQIDDDYIIYLMNVETGESQAILRLGTEGSFSSSQWIQLSPDGQTLLVSRYTQVRFWDIDRLLASDTLLDAQTDDPDRGVSMDTRHSTLFHSETQTLIGISDNIIHNYDIITEEAESVFESDLAGTPIQSTVQINPEGTALYVVLAAGELVRYSYPEGMIQETSSRYDTGWEHQFFFYDGNLLTATHNFSGTYIREWSLDNNEPSDEIFQSNDGIIYPVSPEIIMSADGRYLYYSGQQVEDNTSTFDWLHDLETGERHRMSVFFAGRGGIITSDNRLIGLGSSLAYVYDIENIVENENFNQEYSSFYMDSEYINTWFLNGTDDITLSTDGRLMATLPCLTYNSVEEDTFCEIGIALWDMVRGDAIYTLDSANIERFSNVGLSADSQFLGATACVIVEGEERSNCNVFYLYDVSEIPENDSGDVLALDLEPIAILENLTHNINNIRFHPTIFADGSRIVALSGRYSLTTFVKILSDGTVEQLATLPIQGAVNYNPSGNLVVASNRRGEIEIWGVSSGQPEPLAQNNSDELAIRSREVITAQNVTQAEEILTLGNGHAYRMALSPDDQTLAIASDGIYLHNAQNLSADPQFIGSPLSDGIRHLEYADNGDLYVVGSSDYGETLSLYRWDASSSQFISLYSTNDMSDKIIQHIDLSPDGEQLLIATCEGYNGVISVAPYMYCQSPAQVDIQIIDLNNPENVRAISTQNTSNAVVAINPDWTQLAYYDNGSIYLYDMATGESQRVIEVITSTDSNRSTGLPSELWSLYFTPDGTELAFLATANGDYELWSIDELNQVDNDNPLVRQEDVSNMPSSWSALLAFHPQTNDRLVSRSDSISTFSAEDASRLDEFSNVWQVRAIELASDGERVYTLSSTGAVQVWDWSTRAQIDSNIDYALSSYMSISVSNDSQLLVNDSGNNDDSMSFIWDTSASNIDPQALLADDSSMQPIIATAISPDNRYVAYVQNYQLYVYDREMNEHRQIDVLVNVVDLSFRDDGSLILITVERGNGIIKTYYPQLLETGDVPYPFEGRTISNLLFNAHYASKYISPYSSELTLSPDGNTIAIKHCGNVVNPYPTDPNCEAIGFELIATESGATIANLRSTLTSEGRYEQLVYSADGQYLAMGYCADTIPEGWACEDNQGAVDIWRIEDIRAGQTEPRLTVTDLPYQQNAISLTNYDGTFLLETTNWEPISDDVWDTFTRFWSISADGTATEIQRIHANVLGFSPDGRLMIILDDGQIELWAIPLDMTTVSTE